MMIAGGFCGADGGKTPARPDAEVASKGSGVAEGELWKVGRRKFRRGGAGEQESTDMAGSNKPQISKVQYYMSL